MSISNAMQTAKINISYHITIQQMSTAYVIELVRDMHLQLNRLLHVLIGRTIQKEKRNPLLFRALFHMALTF